LPSLRPLVDRLSLRTHAPCHGCAEEDDDDVDENDDDGDDGDDGDKYDVDSSLGGSAAGGGQADDDGDGGSNEAGEVADEIVNEAYGYDPPAFF
jgi:hypothetical protein